MEQDYHSGDWPSSDCLNLFPKNTLATRDFQSTQKSDLVNRARIRTPPEDVDGASNKTLTKLLIRRVDPECSPQDSRLAKSSKGLDEMTGVFSLCSKPSSKPPFRRKMTEEERVDYRERRLLRACPPCRAAKRKVCQRASDRCACAR